MKPLLQVSRIERAMLKLTCLHCGPRHEDEFRCGGDSHIARPPLSATDDEWAAYLFEHDNPKGYRIERWCHSFGCGLWFNVVRNTVSHEIVTTYGMTEPEWTPKP